MFEVSAIKNAIYKKEHFLLNACFRALCTVAYEFLLERPIECYHSSMKIRVITVCRIFLFI